MPRDLFGDVTRPSISIGNRKWYTVPVSLLSHTIVVAMIVIVPILAAPMMPGVLDSGSLTRYIDVVPPTPPPPPAIRKTELKPVENPNAAPLSAQEGIKPETFVPVEISGSEVGVVGGAENLDIVLAPPPPVVVKQQEPPKPVQVGGTIRRPMKVGGADPAYSPMARAAGVQGLVIIEATIGIDGRVTNTRVLRGVPLLDQLALDAVRTWEYTPTLLNGVPVPVIMTVTVTFTLSR